MLGAPRAAEAEGPRVVALSLLVVDHQSSVRRLLEVVASEDVRYGVVVTAEGAAAGRQQAFRHQPDAVLLDAGPGHDGGRAAIEDLRRLVPGVVVVLHSSDSFVDHDSAREAGADLFVPKGTDVDLLLDLLLDLVAGRGGC
jgi:DNA-binding NarL/FixJ family response regulator